METNLRETAEIMPTIAHLVLDGLGEAGFRWTDKAGQTHEFGVRALLISADGSLGVVRLDTLNTPGRRAFFADMAGAKVVDQIRVKISTLLGRPVRVAVCNTFDVEFVVDFEGIESAILPARVGLSSVFSDIRPFTIPLGHSLDGPVWYDIRKGRHFIITGSTGTGKSMLMNSWIRALLERTGPEQVRFAFIDPQAVEFAPYRNLDRYLFAPVACEPGEIVALLDRLDEEYRRRIVLLQKRGVKHLWTYNEIAAPLPYVVIASDELQVLWADASNAEWERILRRLRSLLAGSRKVGFRCWLCMQYLKADIVSTEIAAQAGVIFAFKNTYYGSRQTLKDGSASALPDIPGRFIVDDGLKRQVLQGYYIDDAELRSFLQEFEGRQLEQVYPVDDLVLSIVQFILDRGGACGLDALEEQFRVSPKKIARRQLRRLLTIFRGIGLMVPGGPNTPGELTVKSQDEAIEILKRYPLSFERGADGFCTISWGGRADGPDGADE